MNGDSSFSPGRTHYESAMGGINDSLEESGMRGTNVLPVNGSAGDPFNASPAVNMPLPPAKSRMSFFSMKQFDPLLRTPRTPQEFTRFTETVPSPVVESPAGPSDGPLIPVTPVSGPVLPVDSSPSSSSKTATTPASSANMTTSIRVNGSGPLETSFKVNGSSGMTATAFSRQSLSHADEKQTLLDDAWNIIDSLSAANEELVRVVELQQRKIDQLIAEQQSFAGVISEIKRLRGE